MSATEKISITIARGELRHARTLASRLGVSLSTFISHAVRDRVAEQARREAAAAVLAGFSAEDRATEEEMAALLGRWGVQPGAPAAARTRTRPRARPTSPARAPARNPARPGGR